MDLEFVTLKTIKSLPPWTGARWNALFRLVSREAGTPPEEAYEALIPERWSQGPWLKDQVFTIRLISDPNKTSQTAAFFGALHGEKILGSGEFVLGQTLALKAMTIPYSLFEDEPADYWPPLPQELLAAEIEALEKIEGNWRINLLSPARLTRPANSPGFHEYAGPEYFDWPLALEHFIQRIRIPEPDLQDPPFESPPADLPKTLAPSPLAILSHSVIWNDLAYNRDRKMRLGGLIGQVLIAGRPNREEARRLVWGQYLGLGKNARFGFGFYMIPELEPFRRLTLLPYPNAGPKPKK
ncbi:MAG: CRISPR system precrRNA processing endoribonuclease RAMP protein Cas6 [Deltaproteobacteria bacterium]|jgi:hypothetical protein|nr:CRISPR system precrRNA processing endoribonuclease RAMP protein Cas6 [Deltaproteobacteria bacterium]